MIRVDFHSHVGVVHGGRNEATPAPADLAAASFKKNLVTHACVCYTDRPSMDRLVELCPEIKFYKLQWIADVHQKLDDDIQGIKLHSHRGTGFAFGKDMQGLDYSSKEVKAFLQSLPEGLIVQYHTQGSASLNNVSRPYQIGKLATQNRHLKHVIVHSGSYGLQSFYPSTPSPDLIITAISQEMLVQEAVLMANRLANVYLDTSTLVAPKHYKSDLLLTGTKKAAFGSDWPYGAKLEISSILGAEKLARRFMSEEDVFKIHDRALQFLEAPMAKLFEEQGEIVNEYCGRSEAFQEVLRLSPSRRKKSAE